MSQLNKIKINILGSCVTREIFITENNTNYKELFELGTDIWQTAIPCFLSDPFLGVDIPEGIGNFQLKSLKAHSKKTGRASVAEESPDYLIFDLYADVRYGCARVGKKFITNIPSTFRKTNFFKEKKYNEILHSSRPEKYFELFKTNFQSFIEWKKDKLPNTKLILNKFRYASAYLESGIYKEYSEEKFPYIEKDLMFFELLENYILENYGDEILVLDVTDRVAFGNPNHRAGNTPWHFNRDHFEYSMYKLYELILKEQLTYTKNESKKKFFIF